MMCKISVITPIFNGKKYIKDLIDYEIERYKNLEDSERRNFEWSPLTFFIDIVDDVVVSVGYMAP